MLGIYLDLQIGLKTISFEIHPLSWTLKPYKAGYTDPDFDVNMDYNIFYSFLCFSIRFKKRMDLSQFLIDKSK